MEHLVINIIILFATVGLLLVALLFNTGHLRGRTHDDVPEELSVMDLINEGVCRSPRKILRFNKLRTSNKPDVIEKLSDLIQEVERGGQKSAVLRTLLLQKLSFFSGKSYLNSEQEKTKIRTIIQPPYPTQIREKIERTLKQL
jgi:hypothetical protein